MELWGIKKYKTSPIVEYKGEIYPKICLCGSTRFKEDFFDWARFLTLEGAIVTMPMVFGHAGDEITDEQKKRLDNLHKAKIKDSHAIVVINKNGYIGESTRSEIEFAKKLNKDIIYIEELEG